MAKTKDEIIIAALMSTPTIKDASKACKVSERTIYSRLNERYFRSKYNKARQELLEQNSRRLQALLGEAIEGMYIIACDDGNSAQVRLNAYEAIVRASLRITEQADIMQRINQLERTMLH